MNQFKELEVSSGHSFQSIEFAKLLDAADPISQLRYDFCIPKKSVVVPPTVQGLSKEELEEECIYLAGNSLGLMPKRTLDLVNEELKVWSQSFVFGLPAMNNP